MGSEAMGLPEVDRLSQRRSKSYRIAARLEHDCPAQQTDMSLPTDTLRQVSTPIQSQRTSAQAQPLQLASPPPGRSRGLAHSWVRRSHNESFLRLHANMDRCH